MSESDYERRVKDVLDRVARGHLTSDEAATLIAALTKPDATPAAGTTPASAPEATPDATPTPDAEPTGAGSPDADSAADADSRVGWPEDVPSASVWADAVDSPDAADQAPGPKHAAATSTDSTPGAPASGPTADSAASSSTDSAPGASTSGATADSASTEPTAGTAGAAAGAAGEGADETLDSVVDDAPIEGALVDEPSDAEPTEEEREADHSNVPMPSGVRRVTIRAVGRRVRLIGEPAINGVAVDGPHVIKRDGDTLAITSDGDMGVSIDGFSMLRTRSVGDLKSHVNGFARELSIRVNPMLEVEIEVTGGSVAAERLPGLTRVRVTAGTAKVTDVDGPIDLLVQAGSANLDAQITKGRSRVRVESGTATVNLRRGSDVRVHTESQLGRVTWTGAVSGQSKDVEIGRGRAALDVEVLVGQAQIASD
ncbi:hypothetical protein EV643_114210 [Kribbella sp. VKM Ac-2527]|uniref:Adhesin n=1 Tax=Kribbella caucasensis TaxID=2512215 RepID=A0A4R6K6S5_9ACTN|nr:hypothetical protein [Kribbella sp. VKM Ac-2527]TDO45065.1 hypothetical protein EV643_114210 [Kribbella sp. VKM Ac-2527]